MANARIGNYLFAIDPTTASWGYTLNVKSIDTYGGRVIQTLSCKIDKLTIGGYLPVPKGNQGRYDYMLEFERNITAIMEYHSTAKKPVIFNYPALDWCAWVYLLGYKDVKFDVATSAISYSLTFEVDNGFESLLTTAESYGLDLINSGVEYVRNEFNTPRLTWEQLKTAYEKLLDDAGTMELLDSIYDYLDQEEGDGADGENTSDKATSTTGNVAGAVGGKIGNLVNTASDIVLNGSTVNENSAFGQMFGRLARAKAEVAER